MVVITHYFVFVIMGQCCFKESFIAEDSFVTLSLFSISNEPVSKKKPNDYSLKVLQSLVDVR